MTPRWRLSVNRVPAMALSALAAASSIVCHAALPPSKAALRTRRSGLSISERRCDIGNCFARTVRENHVEL